METIDDIVREMRSEPLAEGGAKPWLHYLADRIEAAAKAALKPKKYEYSIKHPNGEITKSHEDEMFPVMPLICKVVRREVGEWEEANGRDGE